MAATTVLCPDWVSETPSSALMSVQSRVGMVNTTTGRNCRANRCISPCARLLGCMCTWMPTMPFAPCTCAPVALEETP